MGGTLSVVFKIAADISALERGVNKATGVLDSLAGAVKAAFTVAAIERAITSVVRFASQLSDLSARTGISTSGLQRLELAFRSTGGTIEAVVAASDFLSKTLVGGGASVVSAMGTLGLSIKDLLALSPEQRFITVADAIGQIQNPAERAYARVLLLGRGSAALAAGMTGDLARITQEFDRLGQVVEDDTVAALDTFGDQVQSVGRSLLVVGATALAPLLPALSALATALQRIASILGTGLSVAIRSFQTAVGLLLEGLARFLAAMVVLAQKIPFVGTQLTGLADASRWLTAYADGTKDAIHGLWNETVKMTPVVTAAKTPLLGLGEGADKAGEKLRELRSRVRELEGQAFPGFFGLPESLRDLGRSYDDSHLGDLIRDVEKAESATQIAVFGFRGMADGLDKIGDQVTPLISDLEQLSWDRFIGPLTRGADPVVRTIRTWSDHLGNVEDVLGGIQNTWANMAVVAVRAIQGIGKALAKGDWVGAIVIGLSAVSQFIGKLFGRDAETQVNPLRQKFVDAAGGLDLLNVRAAAAGVTLTAMLDARTPAAYEVAIRSLNDAFTFQDHAMKLLDDTIKKYGFNLDQLGPTLAKQKLNEQAAALIRDFRILEAAGIGVNNISIQMADSINQYLQAAIRTGTAVPESMRAILNQLATMGLLTDANGDKITDLATSGVTFAQTLDEQFGTLITTIERLVLAIERGLGGAIRDIPDAHVQVVYDDPGRPDTIGAGLEGFARGSGGFRDFGAGTPVMLHGVERVVPRGEDAGGSQVSVNVNAQGAFFDTPVSRQRLAELIRASVGDELRRTRRLNAA